MWVQVLTKDNEIMNFDLESLTMKDLQTLVEVCGYEIVNYIHYEPREEF